MTRRRVLAVVVLVAVAAMGAGYVAARRMTSPQEAAARAIPPPAGPITAPVERRALESKVVVRGDTVYDESVELHVETSALTTPAIVTGRPPAVGTSIAEGEVLLEITGRPVIVLGGDIPTYRDLGPGSHGPDVAELELALQRLGIDVGTVDDVYDAGTAAGVVQLYGNIGYDRPAASAEAQARVTAAASALDQAKDALAAAQASLTAAQVGPTQSEQLAADASVNAAQRTLDAARAGGDTSAIADANDQLAIAVAQRAELLSPKDTSEQQAALSLAQQAQDTAATELWEATAAAATPLPAAEVVMVPNLPRRIDTVTAIRGEVLDGAAMTVSGATVVVRATLDAADKALVSAGMDAVITSGDVQIPGVVDALTDESASGGATAVVRLVDPTAEQLDAIRGLNVQVTVPIAATNGDVLCVPLAALSAGAGGESRVEVAHPDGTTSLVRVTVGLAAEGYAEIDPVDGTVDEGDLVVIGR